jgi:hypothetical protein
MRRSFAVFSFSIVALFALNVQAAFRSAPGGACSVLQKSDGSSVTYSVECPLIAGNDFRGDKVNVAYVDVKLRPIGANEISSCPGTQTVYASMCQATYTGSLSCQAAGSGAVVEGSLTDIPVPATPTNNDPNFWDYYYIRVWSTCPRLTVVGAGWGQ